MASAETTAAAPAAILSRPFYLAHRLATLTVRPGAPKARPQSLNGPVVLPQSPDVAPPVLELPTLDADFAYHRVVNRWLYVFQQRGDKWAWAGEYWVDKDGGYHSVDMKSARGKERNARPQPSQDSLKLLSLAYKINGKQVLYGFYLSGTRLALQTITKLESKDL